MENSTVVSERLPGQLLGMLNDFWLVYVFQRNK